MLASSQRILPHPSATGAPSRREPFVSLRSERTTNGRPYGFVMDYNYTGRGGACSSRLFLGQSRRSVVARLLITSPSLLIKIWLPYLLSRENQEVFGAWTKEYFARQIIWTLRISTLCLRKNLKNYETRNSFNYLEVLLRASREHHLSFKRTQNDVAASRK